MQVRGDAEREAVAAFDEVAAGSGRRAPDVMLPAEARQDVPGSHEAGIFEAARDAITIGRGIGEAVLRLDEIQREAVRRRDRRAVTAAQLVVAADVGARAVEAQAAIVRAAGQLVGHVLDVREAGFGDEHHLRGLEHVRERLGRGELHLVGVVQIPALHLLVETEAAELAAMRERRGGRHAFRAGGRQRRAAQRREALLERRERREQQLDVVELQRHVLAIGDFALQRDAAPLQLRVERQADELDVLRILGEVAGGERVLVRGDVAGLRRSRRRARAACSRRWWRTAWPCASERLPPAAAERATRRDCAAVAMAAVERQARPRAPAPRAPTAFSAPKALPTPSCVPVWPEISGRRLW